ncbi:MAG: hypothetical protein ACFHWZ_14380 [Phycisphaerales bacterium]
MQFDRAELDDRLRERMELLQRWSRVIRHDLGNVVYPSRSLMEKAANEGEAGRKLGDRVRVLTEMMEANRAVLAFLGPLSPSDSDAAVIAAEWWPHAKSLLRGSEWLLDNHGSDTARSSASDLGVRAHPSRFFRDDRG